MILYFNYKRNRKGFHWIGIFISISKLQGLYQQVYFIVERKPKIFTSYFNASTIACTFLRTMPS